MTSNIHLGGLGDSVNSDCAGGNHVGLPELDVGNHGLHPNVGSHGLSTANMLSPPPLMPPTLSA